MMMELSHLLVRVAYCVLIFLRALFILVSDARMRNKERWNKKQKYAQEERGCLEPTFKLKPAKWKVVTPFF